MSFFEFPNTRTYDSDLGWLILTVHSHDETLKALDEWAENTDLSVKELEDFKKALEDGNLPQGVRDGLLEWAALNIPDLLAEAIKTVFFTLENGYFVAWIPDSWDEITFGTSGLDDFPVGVDYGHLTLSY
jgi:hypothetical protein